MTFAQTTSPLNNGAARQIGLRTGITFRRRTNSRGTHPRLFCKMAGKDT